MSQIVQAEPLTAIPIVLLIVLPAHAFMSSRPHMANALSMIFNLSLIWQDEARRLNQHQPRVSSDRGLKVAFFLNLGR